MSLKGILPMVLLWLFSNSSQAADINTLPSCLVAAFQDKAQSTATFVVDRALDGDTLLTRDGTQIRLTHIRAPKHTATRTKLRSAPFSKIATNALSALTLGKEVLLAPGYTRDRYRRLQAQVILRPSGDDDLWLQEHLVGQGLVRVDLSRRMKNCGATLLKAEEQARQRQKGLWGSSFYRIRPHDGLEGLAGSFQLVEGTVLDVAQRRNRYFLNFGADWRSDFTITISPKYARSFAKDLDPMTLKGRKVRVRGWVESYNGPFIEAMHPKQIEILDQNTKLAPF